MDSLEAANRALFLVINGTPHSPGWLVALAHICAKELIAVIALLFIALWLTGREQARATVLRACLVAVLALCANLVIRLMWPHPRPFMIGLGYLLFPHSPGPSFPSDHAAFCTAVALTLLAGGLRWSGAVALLVDLAVIWARVFAGMHFPLDMLGAVLVAVLVYAAVVPLWQWRGRAITQAAVTLYRRWFALPIRLNWLRS